MIKRIKHMEALDNLQLKVQFDDGKTVLYDLADDVATIPSYLSLRTEPNLFSQFSLDESRTCVFWNDMIDLPSDIIYEYGQELSAA